MSKSRKPSDGEAGSEEKAVVNPVPKRREWGLDELFPNRLYCILDPDVVAENSVTPTAVGSHWRQMGVRTVQFRCKREDKAAYIEALSSWARWFKTNGFGLLSNDYLLTEADFKAAGLDDLATKYRGVHFGQGDFKGVNLKTLPSNLLVGLSTHNDSQIKAVPDRIDYIGIGPVFASETKSNTESVLGVFGFARHFWETDLPVAAIGGLHESYYDDLADACRSEGRELGKSRMEIRQSMEYRLYMAMIAGALPA